METRKEIINILENNNASEELAQLIGSATAPERHRARCQHISNQIVEFLNRLHLDRDLWPGCELVCLTADIIGTGGTKGLSLPGGGQPSTETLWFGGTGRRWAADGSAWANSEWWELAERDNRIISPDNVSALIGHLEARWLLPTVVRVLAALASGQKRLELQEWADKSPIDIRIEGDLEDWVAVGNRLHKLFKEGE